MSSGVLPRLGNIFVRVVRRVQQNLNNVKFTSYVQEVLRCLSEMSMASKRFGRSCFRFAKSPCLAN